MLKTIGGKSNSNDKKAALDQSDAKPSENNLVFEGGWGESIFQKLHLMSGKSKEELAQIISAHLNQLKNS